jgi:nucleoside-diphosphate-sugar epimerase
MPTVSITGATGFIGGHLLHSLLQRSEFTVRALVHQQPEASLPRSPRLEWMRGDLARVETLAALLASGGDLVNLAYPSSWPRDRHLAATENLAQAAVDAGVRRIVHCSTAVVAGRTLERRVTETTVPEPASEYEVTKLAIERIWLERCGDRVETVILRPTAVFGLGGKNLLKLAQSLTSGSGLSNYLRSSLFRRRRMNLVHVGNVVAAIEFLIDRAAPQAGEIYIVSDDEDPANNFRDVELSLLRAWGRRDYLVPPLPVPPFILSALLRAAGRASTDPGRVYDDAKLRRAGLRKPCGLEQGLREFAVWYAATAATRGAR